MNSTKTSWIRLAMLGQATLAWPMFASCGGVEHEAPDSEAPQAVSTVREPLGLNAVPEGSAPAPLLPILLITVDTLRRDHLGCYGYARPTSPVIDAFAKEGVVFERALATMATTLPSHLSMLTGSYPHQHGVTSNGGGISAPYAPSETITSMARVLSEAGYLTAAFVSSIVISEKTGISDGFEHYAAPTLEEKNLTAEEVTDRALEWMQKLEDPRPLFLWVHYWDTHEPNRPAKDFLSLFERDEALDTWLDEQDIQPDRLLLKHLDSDNIWRMFFLRNKMPAPKRRMAMDKHEMVSGLFNRYDADLRFIDTHLGRVFQEFKQKGLWEETITVFTADHGQALGEADRFGHGLITNINTMVPLIMRFPAGLQMDLPARVAALVSLVDLAPTVLARLEHPELKAAGKRMTGADLFSGSFERSFALTQKASSFHRQVNTDFSCALLEGRWKYFYRQDGSDELYDLSGAGEELDVLAENPEVGAELLAKLQALLAQNGAKLGAQAVYDEESEQLLDNLRKLGYMDDQDE